MITGYIFAEFSCQEFPPKFLGNLNPLDRLSCKAYPIIYSFLFSTRPRFIYFS